MARSTSSIIETEEETKIIRAGERAVDSLKRTFDHWLDIGRALEAGRQACLRTANVDPGVIRGEEGGGFNKLYNEWLTRHGKLDKLSKTNKSQQVLRSYLHKCLQHEEAIVAWRKTMTVVELSRYNVPETVFRNWAEATDFVDPDAQPRRRAKRKTATDQQRETELNYARQRIKNQIDETGDWDHDNPKQIAEKLNQSRPNKAIMVAREVLKDEVGSVHAGLDWDAPEEILVETLLGMVPHNEKALRVFNKVAGRLRRAVERNANGNPPTEETVLVSSNTIQ